MEESELDNLEPMRPGHFMKIEVPIGKKETLLPDLSSLMGENSFANVSLGWGKKGLSIGVEVKRPILHVEYPDIARGDSVELFIDTRDLKSSRHITRFCHHFFFLPKAVESEGATQMGEMTRFRADDAHELADPSLLSCKVKTKPRAYVMHLSIAAEALVGYDPSIFERLGFTYRINQFGGPPQHFCVSSEEYLIEKHPSLWASLKLTT